MGLEKQERQKSAGKEAGFTLFELAVVVVIIGTLFLFSYQKYLDLLVDVEKATVEQTVGVLKSALGMKVAKKVIDGEISTLKKYEGMNPLSLLAEIPNNYKGSLTKRPSEVLAGGFWYFITNEGLLVYKVKNATEFFSESKGLDEIRLRVTLIIDDETKNIAGLSLRTVEKYSWFKKL